MVLRLKGRLFKTETGSRQSSLFLPVHPVPQIDFIWWFCVEEQLWLSLYHLVQLVTLLGMHFLLLFTLQFYQVVPVLPLPSSKPTCSHGALCAGSDSEL